MSRFGAPNDITVMLFLLGFFLIPSINISTVESRNDVTTVIAVICNPILLSPNDPFLTLVDSMMEDITTTTPDEPNLLFSAIYPGQGFTAYGYGECDLDKGEDDCLECLSHCAGEFDPACGPAIGAQINMSGCFMKYENYRFF